MSTIPGNPDNSISQTDDDTKARIAGLFKVIQDIADELESDELAQVLDALATLLQRTGRLVLDVDALEPPEAAMWQDLLGGIAATHGFVEVADS